MPLRRQSRETHTDGVWLSDGLEETLQVLNVHRLSVDAKDACTGTFTPTVVVMVIVGALSASACAVQFCFHLSTLTKMPSAVKVIVIADGVGS